MMTIPMKANVLQYFFKKNPTQGTNVSGLLLRLFLYGGIFVNLLLPFYNFQSNSLGWWGDARENSIVSEPKRNIRRILTAQRDYYAKYSKFSNSLEELNLRIKTESAQYSYQIVAQMIPTQTLNQAKGSASKLENKVAIVQAEYPLLERQITIAQAKYPFLKSYMGVIYSYPRQIPTTSKICEINFLASFPSTLPNFTYDGIKCPPGSIDLGSADN
jgi:hypothetical protein